MNNRTLKIVLLFIAFAMLAVNVFAQNTPTLHVDIKGHGKRTAVLIPGYSCSGKVWDETAARLGNNYTCHIITFPGFGGEKAQGDADIKQWETAVANYIQNNKLQQPVIIGHSMGGVLAMAIAADYPSLPSRVVVVDALPCLAAMQNPAFKAQPDADCKPFLQYFSAMNDEQLLQSQRKITASLVADTTMRDTVVQWAMHSDRKTLGIIYCQFVNTDVREKLANVQCPVNVLLEANFADNNATIQQQYALLKNKTLTYSTKGLHFIMYDDKTWFFQQLGAYLQ
ncbi:alpha/beta fold hydrolase [Deminuibacter soli]|uniref:Alpha/beta hydrolase n=1 Tax=Deminuibacter soli TaxID=2291815 RepID=A0A3E1NQC7_9BACT|nr:alpha/beta hydrolase [Deminuibacter soli]RFM30107.1 alpha/beta hydrolase [Deminuibacter soli]